MGETIRAMVDTKDKDYYLNLFLNAKNPSHVVGEMETFVETMTEYSAGSELTFLQMYKFFAVYAIINEKSSLCSISKQTFNKYLRFLVSGRHDEARPPDWPRK